MKARSRYIALLIAGICLVRSTGIVAAQGSLHRENFRASLCNLASMDIEIELDQSFGEPIITSRMRWLPGPNTSNDCLSPNTRVWVQIRTNEDLVRYIRIQPTVPSAGDGYGAVATESPDWRKLFCEQPAPEARCETRESANRLLASRLEFEGFEVVSDALAVSSLVSADNPVSGSSRHSGTDDADFSLDIMLAEAIDMAIQPEKAARKVEAEPPPQPAAPPATAGPSPEEIARAAARELKRQAEEAKKEVVTLIASSLAEYTSPPHDCESSRQVSNWVQAKGICELNFRSESSHEFLCAEDGRPKPVTTTRRAKINLARDVSKISTIRHSAEGWASLILVLSSDLQSTLEGSYRSSHWQITVDDDHLEDLRKLGGDLLTLKSWCEARTS